MELIGFLDVKPTLHSWNEPHLVMSVYLLIFLLDLIDYKFVLKSYICVHEGYFSVVFSRSV